MIKNFTFENFLSFKEKNTFSFERQSNDSSHKEAFFELQGTDLLKSAVIYGANASGKSNFSKAFVLFHQLVTNGLQLSLANIPIQVAPFLLNTKTETKPSSFEIELLTKKNRFIYGFEVTSERVHKEWLHQFVNNRQRTLFDRKNDEITTNPHHFKEATADLKKMTRSNVLFLTVLASYNGEIANEVVEEIKKITVFPADQKEMILEYSFQNYPKYKNEVWE